MKSCYVMMPSANPLKSAETLAKLRIARTQGIGPVTYRKLMQRYKNVLDIIADWHGISAKFPPLATESAVLKELEQLHKAGGVLVMQGDALYPAQLAELPDAPLTLSVLGAAETLAHRQVAIVGNRSASAAGLTWSKHLAAEISRHNVVMTSGMARGIDTAAHEGALAAGGLTVAVVAAGVDNIYPKENAKIRDAIIEHGCVVSEMPWGMAPSPNLFLRRNRIIAGLSIGVVVSEATRHSGSLVTAEYALNYGREVWAVPGSPSDPRSGGPNWLLKNGATLIENADDVLRDLPQKPAPFVERSIQGDLFRSAPVSTGEVVDDAIVNASDDDENAPTDIQRVFGLLGTQPAAFDDLVRQTDLDGPTLSGILIELELDGHVAREGDGRWRRS